MVDSHKITKSYLQLHSIDCIHTTTDTFHQMYAHSAHAPMFDRCKKKELHITDIFVVTPTPENDRQRIYNFPKSEVHIEITGLKVQE